MIPIHLYLIILCISDEHYPDPPVVDPAEPADGEHEPGLSQVLRHQQGRQVEMTNNSSCAILLDRH